MEKTDEKDEQHEVVRQWREVSVREIIIRF